jgi:acyl carrier protein
MTAHDPDPLPSRLKHLIAAQFRLDLSEPDKIPDHEPLIGGRLGLDSLDALELALSLEEQFGVSIHSQAESNHAFASIAALTAFIHARTGAGGRQRSPAAA